MEKQLSDSTKFDPRHTVQIISQEEDVPSGDEENAVASLPQKPQDRYKFIRSIGFGGMKGVLLVHDSDTDRDVAMAMIPDFRDRPLRDLNRFVREAKITAKLEHPNIVPVHDIGVDGSGSPYFTMKYLHGETLAAILRKKHNKENTDYSLDRLLQVLIRICNAVAFAHSKEICHLDLKPANIICGEYGEVQVIDWGLAAAGKNDFSSGLLQGTPGYMSPEFIRSRGKVHPGPAADIYAIGAILYAMLTNEIPFRGQSQQEILRRQLEGRIAAPHIEHSNVNHGLEAICMKALSVNPEERYQSVNEMRRDIVACIAGYPTKAENPSRLRKFMLYVKRHWITLILLLVIILASIEAFLLLKYNF